MKKKINEKLHFSLAQAVFCLALIFIIMMFTFEAACEGFALSQNGIKEVKIGILAKRGAERCIKKWGPTIDYLTETIPGHSFVLVPLTYDEVYPTVEKKGVDFILVNPAFYVNLEAHHLATRIVTLKNLVMGKSVTEYGGVIFTRADRDDIREFRDLKGKIFISLNEKAFASWPACWYELEESGVDPYHDFSKLLFKSPMDEVVYAVRDGRADAGSVRSDLLERMSLEGKIRLEDFKVLRNHGTIEHDVTEHNISFLHSTKLYPEWPLAKLHHTTDKLSELVAISLMKLTREHPAAIAAKNAGWTLPRNYQSVHKVLKTLKIEPYEEFGKVSLEDVIRNYWPWMIGIFLPITLLIAVYLLIMNRRLFLAVSEKEKELIERKKVEDDLRKAKDEIENWNRELEKRVEGKTRDLKLSQAQLVQSEKLASIGLIGSGVAHELNSPLTGLLTFLKLFQRKRESGSKEYKELSKMIEATNHMGKIVKDLSVFSRNSKGEISDVSLTEVIESALGLTKYLLKRPGGSIEIVKKYGGDIAKLRGNKTHLQQVVLNILTNAIYVMPDGGKITISVNSTPGGNVAMEFKDTGRGIPEDKLSKIFDPFFTTKDPVDGVGLGLTIVKRLVQDHKGEVVVENRKPKGVLVRVTIPISGANNG